jgi:predicted O-methyltransferase YrrM
MVRPVRPMTTSEATALLPRANAHLAPSWRQRFDVVAFGAIQWPWLLRGLHGGRKADKSALLARVGLPADALPNLGSWKADTRFLNHIVNAIEALRPREVVELGCGASSLVIAAALARHGGGRLTSYEQHDDFAEETALWVRSQGFAIDMRHAPLGDAPGDWPGQWYQLHAVPPVIDLLVIDGPPWAVHPLVRGAAEVLFDRLAPGGMILLDDAARPGERIVGKRWRERWPDIDFILDRSGAKGTLIGRRRG